MGYHEKTIISREIYQGKMINLCLEEVELPNGQRSTREIVKHPGGVAIIALTPEEKVLFVRQFRKACEEELWELPAGKIDPGENPETTAIRELAEETGYQAENLRPLISFYTSPGFATEMIHVFFTEDLIPLEQNLDEDEFLSVHQFSWAEISQMMKSGEIIDAKTITGLLLVMAERGVEL